MIAETRKHTQVTFIEGEPQARVKLIDPRAKTEVEQSLPLEKVKDLVLGAIHDPEGAPTPAAGTGLHRITDPTAWKINLFPDIPYGLFEPNGKTGYVVAVRGYEPMTRDLLWRPDYGSREKKTLRFNIPKMIIFTIWRGGAAVGTYVFTCPTAFPNALNDPNTPLAPWGAGNVQPDGAVCWGSTPSLPFGTDGVSGACNAFFGSVFNDHIPNLTMAPGFEEPRNNYGNFSLGKLLEQTTQGKTGEAKKVGEMLHATRGRTTMAAALQRAAGR